MTGWEAALKRRHGDLGRHQAEQLLASILTFIQGNQLSYMHIEMLRLVHINTSSESTPQN